MADPQEDTYSVSPNQKVYDMAHQLDHEVNVIKIFFARKIPKMVWEKKEESYTVKSGGTVADVIKKYEK